MRRVPLDERSITLQNVSHPPDTLNPMFEEELSELSELPAGLDEMAPGPDLGAPLEALDMTDLSGYDLVVVMRAWHRQQATPTPACWRRSRRWRGRRRSKQDCRQTSWTSTPPTRCGQRWDEPGVAEAAWVATQRSVQLGQRRGSWHVGYVGLGAGKGRARWRTSVSYVGSSPPLHREGSAGGQRYRGLLSLPCREGSAGALAEAGGGFQRLTRRPRSSARSALSLGRPPFRFRCRAGAQHGRAAPAAPEAWSRGRAQAVATRP